MATRRGKAPISATDRNSAIVSTPTTVSNNNKTTRDHLSAVKTPSSSQTPGDSDSLMSTSTETPSINQTYCPQCSLSISRNNKTTIQCDICESFYHQPCTAIPVKTFEKLLTIAKTIGWVCSNCKRNAVLAIKENQSAITTLTEQIDEMKKSICQLQQAAHPIPQVNINMKNNGDSNDDERNQSSDTVVKETKQGANYSETALIVHRTLLDADRRRRNIVVAGFGETSDDREAFLKLCEEQLSLKPYISERDCIRIGKKINDRPKLLLVKLRSEEAAAAILQAAPTLRASADPTISSQVYINPDLSPEAAKAAFERRQQRRIRQQSLKPTGSTTIETDGDSQNYTAGRPC